MAESSPASPTSSAPDHGHLPAHRRAVAAAFATQGLLLISLTTRLPTLQEKWDLGEVTLSLVLLAMIALAGVGSLVAERAAVTRPSAVVVRFGLVLVAIGFSTACWAGSFWIWLLGLSVYGTGLGAVDACSNMQAVAVEHRYKRPILPSFHGAWTAGGAVGAAIALTGVPLWAISFLAVVPLSVALTGRFIPRIDAGPPIEDAIPWRPIVLVGCAMTIFYMVDGASQTWGPLYLDNTFATPENLVALATFPYLVAQLGTRLVGDKLVHRFSPVPVLRVGTLIAMAALAIVVFAPTWPVAVVGFAVLGAGVAVVAPLSFSAAARIAAVDGVADMRRTDAVIARLNQFNYLGAVLGSVMTGLVGANSLRVGFAVPMVLVALIIPLARYFAPSPQH